MWALGHAGAKLALALAGIRYRVSGGENVPNTAVVFCSNHESNVDPPVLFEALHRRLHVLYKAELHKFPIMGTVFDVGGFVPIERGDRESAMRSIARSGVVKGRQFVPDISGGHTKPHGPAAPIQERRLDHGHRGAGPRRSRGYQRRTSGHAKGSPIVRPVKVTVRVGKPIPTKGMTLDDQDELIGRVRGEVQKLLDEGPLWT